MKKGTILFNEGDPLNRIFYLKAGFAKAFRLSEEGRETMNYVVGPGHVFGFRSLLSKDEEAQYSAEAMTDLTVITMSHGECFEIVAQHPEILIDLLHAYADRLNYTERKLEGFIYGSTTARITNFLSDCARRFGVKENGAISIPFLLTHQKIADFVGALRETVTLSVNRFEDEQLIQIERGKVKITNMNKLSNYMIFGKKR